MMRGDSIRTDTGIELVRTLTGLREENERLREALKPFGDACEHLGPHYPDGARSLDGFLITDFFAASRALNPIAHYSDCATNNAPALPVGPCDCGGYTPDPTGDK